MIVKLIAKTENLLKTIYVSARTCYNPGSPVDMSDKEYDEEKMLKLVKRCISSGHYSVLEHANFTFAIEGISRACYDENTEVLTSNGWKLFKDINVAEDKFATRNENGEVEFQEALNQTEYEYAGTLHKYKSQNLDLMVTPNHKLYLKKYDVRRSVPYELVASEDLDKQRYYMTKDFQYNPVVSDIIEIDGYEYERKNSKSETYTKVLPSITLDKENFLLLLAWYLSDGSTYYNKEENSYRVQISQTDCEENVKNKTKERILKILNSLGINSNVDNRGVYFKNLVIGKYLHALGVCDKKYIPLDIFKEFNRRYAKIFIDEYFKGDGSINKSNCGKIYTTSKKLADQLYSLCFIAGYTCKVSVQQPRGSHRLNDLVICATKPYYVLNVTLSEKGRNRNIVVKRASHFSLKDYNGKVYCVEVPNHTLFVRRNGISIWCGNCSHQLVRHRHCSYSQQSQRYVNFKERVSTVTPGAITKNPDADKKFNETLAVIEKTYNDLIDLNVKPEDARAILPNACCSNIVVTCNLRELIHICNERLCSRAQSEIRGLTKCMAMEVTDLYPWLSEYLQPKCEALGYCPEDDSCGRKRLRKDRLKD